MIPHPRHNRLLKGSPLQRSGWRKTITAALLVLLAYVTLFHIAMFIIGGSVFLQALALSGLLALVPLGMLWFLDRRERETPWLLAAAFLWGAFIATAVCAVSLVWPATAEIVEESVKALGVLLVFWLLRPEFNNMRDIMLVCSAKWSWLKAWAMKIARHHGLKKAIVALARRLAVIMHRIWVDGSEFRWTRDVAVA